jgi:hypothetical protein
MSYIHGCIDEGVINPPLSASSASGITASTSRLKFSNGTVGRKFLFSPLFCSNNGAAVGHGAGRHRTRERKVLDIRNAPPGTRGQMVAQNGPATAEVKTSYALQGV